MTISRRHIAAAALLASGASVLARSPRSPRRPTPPRSPMRSRPSPRRCLRPTKPGSKFHVADQLGSGHSGGVVQDKAAFVDVIASKKTIYKSIVLSDGTVAVAGSNAIVRHAWLGESESGGKSNVSKIGVLQVWQKQGADWKLLARQAFAKPA